MYNTCKMPQTMAHNKIELKGATQDLQCYLCLVEPAVTKCSLH